MYDSSLLAGGTEASQCSLSATGGARRRSTTKQGNLRKGARAIDNKKVKSEARFANGRIPMLCLVQTGRAALIALQVKTNAVKKTAAAGQKPETKKAAASKKKPVEKKMLQR